MMTFPYSLTTGGRGSLQPWSYPVGGQQVFNQLCLKEVRRVDRKSQSIKSPSSNSEEVQNQSRSTSRSFLVEHQIPTSLFSSRQRWRILKCIIFWSTKEAPWT